MRANANKAAAATFWIGLFLIGSAADSGATLRPVIAMTLLTAAAAITWQATR